MRKVIVNSTPLIALANANALFVLRKLYGTNFIPQAVYDEFTQKEDSACRQIIKEKEWIIVKKVSNDYDRKMYSAKLHLGEVEVMLLAQEENSDVVIIDDNAAKQTAEFLGLPVIGTLGILVHAKRKGIIDNVKNILDEMINNGFYIGQKLYDLVLNRAGE